MQDTIAVITNFRNNPALTLLCSFDGHSGEKSAEFAAKSIARVITSNMMRMEENLFGGKNSKKSKHEEVKPPPEELTLNEAHYISIFENSFENLHFEIRERKFDDGTAALVVLVEDNKRLIVANAGDQRAVVAKGDIAVPISTDHKPDEPGERLRIEDVGGYVN